MNEIQHAKNFTKHCAKDGVIIFHVDEDNCGYVTYGKNQQWIARMNKIAAAIWEDFRRALQTQLYPKEGD